MKLVCFICIKDIILSSIKEYITLLKQNTNKKNLSHVHKPYNAFNFIGYNWKNELYVQLGRENKISSTCESTKNEKFYA